MVYHHAQPQAKARNRSYATSGLVPCSRTPPFSLRFDIALFRHFLPCRFFNFFDFFNLPTTVAHSSPFAYLLIGHRSSLALPHPTLRGDHSQVIYIVAVAYIAVAAKPWNSAPAPAPVPPTTLSPLATTGYAGSYWSTVCRHGMRNGSRMSNEGIAFLSFLWAIVMELLHVLVVDAKDGCLVITRS